jgi:serine/threonine-protein kinase
VTEGTAPAVGRSFGGYTIESLLGRGGMAAVYLATHARLARKVALKVIAPVVADDEDFRSRFLLESQLAASLDHPNVIPIYDAGEVEGVLFLAMRYVPGSSLRQLLRVRGQLPPKETVQIVEQVAAALDAAHAAGLVHRDVKPGNILLADVDAHVYLCDFGLAKRESSHGLTRAGAFLGSVDYCAPEQIEGRTVDGRADVYSLGCVVFHCLTGEPPFRRDGEFAVLNAHLHDAPPAVSDLRPDLPRAFDAAVATALAKDPDARFQTAGALAKGLRGDDDATRAAPALEAPTRALVRPWRRRRLIAALVLAAAIAIVAAVTAVLATRSSHESPPAATPQSAALRTFVVRIEHLLEQSQSGRSDIAYALTRGFNCSIPRSEAAARVKSVADNRQSILVQLGNLRTPTPEADDVVTRLQAALQQSIEADRHYHDGFVGDANAKCPLPTNESFRSAARFDNAASSAKERFVEAFNPLAQRFDRTTWSADNF